MNTDNPSVRNEARQWVVEMSAADVSADTIAAFDSWLQAGEDNARVYQEVESLFLGLADVLGLEGMLVDDADASYESAGVWQRIKAAFTPSQGAGYWAGAAAAVIIAIGVLNYWPAGAPVTESLEYQTAAAEIKTITLGDGSEITLGGETQLFVTFSDQRRQITLPTGQAFFEVASDASRPFVVISGAAEITVLGTSFDVRKGRKHVTVGVEQGAVNVRGIDYLTKDILGEQKLVADTTISVAADGSLSKIAIEENPGSWRQGRLVYVDANLGRDVVRCGSLSSGKNTIRF